MLDMSLTFDKSWTVFLDRDGVINLEKADDYIHHRDEFLFYPGAPEAITKLSHFFRYVIVVTNQKGIGKGVTDEAEVKRIHEYMVARIVLEGGRIDAVYYCPDVDDNSPCRKPNPGMALKAKADFPEIDFAKSIMVGNNLSDLQFGRNLGMKTAFLRTTKPHIDLPEGMADFDAAHLATLAETLASLFVDC
jgi:histidinol-phosphate phosphatase family protein